MAITGTKQLRYCNYICPKSLYMCVYETGDVCVIQSFSSKCKLFVRVVGKKAKMITKVLEDTKGPSGERPWDTSVHIGAC